MSRLAIIASLLAVACPSLALGLPGSTGAVGAWKCPGSKTLTIWFWPSGHGTHNVGYKTTDVHAMLFTGTSAKASLGSYIATAQAVPDLVGDSSVHGALCRPEGTIDMDSVPSGTLRRATTALTCRLPATPLLGYDRPSPTRGRMRVVLPSGRFVAAMDLTTRGSKLVYSSTLCKLEPRPDRP